MDAQNVGARLHRGGGKLDFAVDAARAEERRVENIEAVGGHDDFDVFRGFEAVELVEEFEHCALNFRVTARATLNTGRANGVDFVHEDDAGGVLARHDEELAHHAATFADVFLHKLGAGDADEFAFSVVGYCSCEESFAGTGRAVE